MPFIDLSSYSHSNRISGGKWDRTFILDNAGLSSLSGFSGFSGPSEMGFTFQKAWRRICLGCIDKVLDVI
jgi:hypothetical protein